MTVVTRDSCNNAVSGAATVAEQINAATFTVSGKNVETQELGDMHDQRLDHFRQYYTLDVLDSFEGEHCYVHLEIYPTLEYFNTYQTSTPIVYALIVLAIFALTGSFFLVYDCFGKIVSLLYF